MHIWPRGLQINSINQINQKNIKNAQLNIGVWQHLADGNPDVDAIYRLVINKKIIFEKNGNFVLDKNLFCPFNSQNTFWSSKAFLFMYLPCTVAFRYTDILRSYICQKLLWNKNMHLGFSSASVEQKRNYHDLMKDFKDEITMYETVNRVIEILNNISIDKLNDSEALLLIYESLANEKIVSFEEVELVQLWINDFNLIYNHYQNK